MAGDTTAGANRVEQFNCALGLYPGPEAVYTFNNPVQQQVDIALGNAAPGLSVFLTDSCDEGRCLASDGDALIRPSLAPGDYFVIVDGEAGASGPFELAAVCGPSRLEPDRLDALLQPGQSIDETKRVILPTHVPMGDIIFSVDCTGSMNNELAQVRQNIRDIVAQLELFIDDVHFGLVTFSEYDVPLVDTVCPAAARAPGPDATPFTLNLPLTGDLAAMQSALDGVNMLGGGIESYTRTLYEAYANPNIGWRDCAKKLWINFGDEIPQDCNVEGQ